MKSSFWAIGIGAGITIFACNADLRDNNVCVMYARALCEKAASCGLTGDKTAEQCLAPYVESGCDEWENSDSNPDPRACGKAIADATCPADAPVKVADCKGEMSKSALVDFAANKGGFGIRPADGIDGTGGSSGRGGSSGSGGSSASGGSGGSSGSGGTGGRGGTGGSGGSGGSSGASGTGGSGGSAGTATCTSFAPDTNYPCGLTVPTSCGSNAVSCGNNYYCAANSTCGTNMSCSCNSGYVSVSCATGQKCNGCSGGTWGCAPRPDPGCLGNPAQAAGICRCSNGTTYSNECGNTITCDQRCRRGF